MSSGSLRRAYDVLSGVPTLSFFLRPERNTLLIYIYMFNAYEEQYITGRSFQPLWKIWKSVGIIIPNIWKNKSHVPNYQPDNHDTSSVHISYSIQDLKGHTSWLVCAKIPCYKPNFFGGMMATTHLGCDVGHWIPQDFRCWSIPQLDSNDSNLPKESAYYCVYQDFTMI